MALTEEQIRKIMIKEIKSKTMLVSILDVEKIKKEHLDEGWEIFNETPLNGRVKITFRKVK